MIYLLIAIIFVIIGIPIGYKLNNRQIDKKNIEIERINNQLDIEYQNKLRRNKDYDNKIEKAQEDYRAAEAKMVGQLHERELEIQSRIQELEQNLLTMRDYRFGKINEAAARYREELIDNIAEDVLAAQEMSNEKKEKMAFQINSLQEEILQLQASRNALIEAQKREEEKKLQEDFYKIQITEQAFNDIRILRTIEHSLYNKEALYKLVWSVFYLAPVKDMLSRVIGKEKTSGIYKITNQNNGKVYIGQSVDLHTRLTNHCKAALGISSIAHQQIHDAMAAEGLENFTFEVVEKCDKGLLNQKEKLWIETYGSDKYGYNKTAGGS